MARQKRGGRTTGWYIDQHVRLRRKREDLREKLRAINEDLSELESEALHKFGAEGLRGARGRLGVGFVKTDDHYTIADRRKFESYVKRTGRFELFQGRVSKTAVREVLDVSPRTKLSSMGVGVFHEEKFGTQSRD